MEILTELSHVDSSEASKHLRSHTRPCLSRNSSSFRNNSCDKVVKVQKNTNQDLTDPWGNQLLFSRVWNWKWKPWHLPDAQLYVLICLKCLTQRGLWIEVWITVLKAAERLLIEPVRRGWQSLVVKVVDLKVFKGLNVLSMVGVAIKRIVLKRKKNSSTHRISASEKKFPASLDHRPAAWTSECVIDLWIFDPVRPRSTVCRPSGLRAV